ncbi:MAG: hypothetical protein VKJ86_03245 [Synechococcus sp.]|nr:hypothetical protein [Synechococcus sp.]
MAQMKRINLMLDPENPGFLAGLNDLLQRGLISEETVRDIGRSHLACPLPDYGVIRETWITPSEPTPKAASLQGLAPTISLEKSAKIGRSAPTIIENFLEELSVRWLLFLGVFLVVLSSGVLVASQWSNFPVVGQYLVLWSYTVVFGIIGFWAKTQEGLRLTALTLQIVAVLLVPFNFWAADQLGVWQVPFQGMMAIAMTLILVLGMDRVAQSWGWSRTMRGSFFALGFVHWGWDLLLSPVLAVYGGIGLGIFMIWGLPLVAKRSHPQKVPDSEGLEFALFGLGLLLFRAIAVAGVPIGVMGLAIGLLGWLLTELEQQKIIRGKSTVSTEAIAHPWETGGSGFLLLGWLVTVGRYDWQVLGVSALGIVWLLKKLRRHWLVEDLIALFVVGLQGGILCRNVIPMAIKTSVTTAAVDFSQAYDFPYAIYSVTLLPYVLLWAIAALWFHRHEKKQLASVSETLILGLGFVLAGVSLPNPTWRAVNLTISAALSFYFAEYSCPQQRVGYLYLCHTMTLFALGGIVAHFLPVTDFLGWGIVCLIGVTLEWGFCLWTTPDQRRKSWQRSSWYFGSLLAIASFLYLFLTPFTVSPLWRLLGLVVPGMALGVAACRKRHGRRKGLVVSTLSFVILPLGGFLSHDLFLVGRGNFPQSASWWFLCLAVAIAWGLMFFNVRLMPLLGFAHVHFAFGAAFVIIVTIQRVQAWQWLMVTALVGGLCWGLTRQLQGQRRYVGRLYRKVSHQWGLFFNGAVALVLGTYCLEQWPAWGQTVPQVEIFVSGVILLVGLLVRYGSRPREEAFVLGAVAVEALLTEGVILQGGKPMAIAVGHLILATVFLGLQRNVFKFENLLWWRAYPLMFTLVGWAWRWGYFATYSGLISIAAGFLLLAIAPTYPKNSFLRFLGFCGFTIGLYETVIYQMVQQSGGNIGDALTVFALISITIALIYRTLHWCCSTQRKAAISAIPIREFLIAAHGHWFLAAAFKLFTLPSFLPEPPSLKILAIAVSIGLITYALIQARNPVLEKASQWSDWWIYVGAIELASTGIQARWMWTQLENLDAFRVLLVSVLALIIFQLPWSNLGWQESPWHRVGIATPALCLAMTASDEISYLSLLSIGFVYLRLVQIQHNIRWSYISLIFGNWLLGKFLFDFNLLQPLSHALQIGLSILLIAQIDPDLKHKKQRNVRHFWRLIGSGVICVIALIHYQEFGLTPAIMGLSLIFLALGTHIRAFLYNGTIVLTLTGLYQLVILIDRYSFAKWIIGLVAGIVLISIAANFEQRRLQILAVLDNWVEALNQWQ